jgi:hypothetical protein
MTEAAQVLAGERGVVRVFALGYRVSMELAHFEAVDRLKEALGLADLNADDVQIVEIKAIAEMGLSGFLVEAYDVAEDEIATHRDNLDALKGHVAVLRSGAFAGAAATLPTTGEARLVAVLHEPRMSAPEPMPRYDSATGAAGTPQKKPVSDKAMSGRIAMYALLFVFAFTVLFVWIAS